MSSPNIFCNLCKGTTILVKPGIIAGGSIVHDCPLARSVGYFLEAMVMLAPFSKRPMHLTLRGVTTDDKDLSVCVSLVRGFCHGFKFVPR
jgi:RNA 3'-terminal phosphate cyclase